MINIMLILTDTVLHSILCFNALKIMETNKYYQSFVNQEMWFWNCEPGWQVENLKVFSPKKYRQTTSHATCNKF